MAWNCDLSAEEIRAWQARYPVRLFPEAYQRWVIAVAVPRAEPDSYAATLVRRALRGYFGSEVPLVGRSGGERGQISDLELTTHPENWTINLSAGDWQVVNAIAESDRPTVLLGDADASGARPRRLVWVEAAFVYRGTLDRAPWFVWDFAPAVQPVGWEPECPLKADAVLTAASVETGRVVPDPDAADWTLGERVVRAAAQVGSGLALLGGGIALAGLLWALRRRR